MSDEMNYQQQVLSEIVAVLGTGPEVTISEIESGLGALYAQHSDEWAQTLIVDTWAKVQLVAQTASNAITMAGAAREVAATLQKQRDAAVEQHTELQTAMRNFDRDHPLVDDLVTGVEELIMEDVMYDQAYMHMCEASNMYEVAGLDISGAEADTFLAMLTDTAIDDNTDPNIGQRLRDKLSAFIREIVREYDAATELWDGAE